MSVASGSVESIDWSRLQHQIGYRFRDKEKLTRACTRKACAKEQKDLGIDCRDQDAFRVLGDAVLKAILVDLLMEKRGLETRGQITEKKKQYESTDGLHRKAIELGIADFILMSQGEKITDTKRRPRVQAETLEALVGAIYRDGGFETAKAIAGTWFKI